MVYNIIIDFGGDVMLVFPINATSVQESNIFLRKLWSELNTVTPMGWNMYPYKAGTKVTIGTSTLGEISFNYKRKGCIKNLYIENDTHTEDISAAVNRAKANEMKQYSLSLELANNRGISLADVSFEGGRVFTRKGKTFLQLNFEAYSEWDVEMFLPNKYAPILSILYEYTQVLFDIVKIDFAVGALPVEVTECPEYNYDWIDLDECPCLEDNSVILPRECFQLLSYIMDDKSYDEDTELLLNSSRVLMTTKHLSKEIEFPDSSGKADIINSMVCSSFEPLSLILDKRNKQCKECGNMVFSITKKIKRMCTHYFGAGFAKYVCDVIYKNRSVFLHTGRQESPQRSSKTFCPQISAESGVVMMPHGRVRDDVFDYSAFLFRNIARDYFNRQLPEKR